MKKKYDTIKIELEQLANKKQKKKTRIKTGKKIKKKFKSPKLKRVIYLLASRELHRGRSI